MANLFAGDHLPGDKVTNQVQFTAGYTFKKGSAVQVVIGKRKFGTFHQRRQRLGAEQKIANIVRAMRSGRG